MSRLHGIPLRRRQSRRRSLDRPGAPGRCVTATWSASLRKARSREPAICCRSVGDSRHRRGTRCAGHPVISIAVWQCLQIQARQVFLDSAERLPYPGNRHLRRASRGHRHRQGDAVAVSDWVPRPCAIDIRPPTTPHTRSSDRHDATGANSPGRQHRPDALVGRLIKAHSSRRRHSPAHRGSRTGGSAPALVGGRRPHNLATLMAGRGPVNLNFTTGTDVWRPQRRGEHHHGDQPHDVSSTKPASPPHRTWCFSKTSAPGSRGPSLLGLLRAALVPLRWLRRRIGQPGGRRSSAAAIIFKRSTGCPRAWCSPTPTWLSNVDSLAQIFHMHQADCFIGVLPFFIRSA